MKGLLINFVFAAVGAIFPGLFMAAMVGSWVVGAITYAVCFYGFFDIGQPKAERGESWK